MRGVRRVMPAETAAALSRAVPAKADPQVKGKVPFPLFSTLRASAPSFSSPV